MESMLIEVGKSVPSLVVLVYIIIKFLAALKDRDDLLAKLKTDLTVVIERNTVALTEAKIAIEKFKMLWEDKNVK